MSDTPVDAQNQPSEFDFEPCFEIHEGEARAGAKPGYDGLLKNAPGCSTSVVNGLSQQLIHQMNLILPDALVSFDDLNVELEDAAFPFLQPQAKLGLQKAIQERGTKMHVNSAYRTIAQQLLLHRWGIGCGFTRVALPGKSNHQSGLALDINDHLGWKPYLERHGWRWFGPNDKPHFDFVGGGTKDIRGTAMLALQKLWNKNHPNEKISEDSAFGPQTESALNRSPALGFDRAPWDEKPRVLKLSRPLMEGSDVKKLQESLQKAGITVSVDWVFGPGTDKAVKEFQQKKSLVADGIVGPNTLQQMA
ncbi:MAG TPA: peptidoglycan-binding protein [Stenomitos sp.]